MACFSATGTTKAVAKAVATAGDATLYEIKPEQEYTSSDLDWTNKQSRVSVEMADKSSRPAIIKDLKDSDKYDTIFIGFPIWWNQQPTIINTFIDTYGFENKTIALFATSGGSSISNTIKVLKSQYPNLNIVSGKLLNDDSESEIKNWIDSIKR